MMNLTGPRLLKPLALITLLAAVACDDPSSAGLELVDDVGARPIVFSEAPTRVESDEIRDETGDAARVLSGVVDDPVTGTVEATGYVDFAEPAAPSSAFRNGPVTAVELELRVDYVYGDTLATATLNLNDMPEEWAAAGVAADSVLQVGPFVASVPFVPSDSVVTVSLPTTWIDANGPILRGAGSDTLFHGFQLSAAGGNAVVGFNVSESVLTIASGGETISYPVNRRLTTSRRTAPASPPADRLLIQDTAGPGVALEFDLADNALGSAVLNRGQIKVSIDTLTLASNTPAGFVRPPVTRLDLQAVTTAGGILLLEGANVVDGTVTFSGTVVRVAMQGLADDVGAVDHFRVVASIGQDGVGSALIVAGSGDDAPVAEITYSKLQ